MELTAGLSPNLKEVIVLNLLPAGSTKSLRPRGSWQGLPGFAGGNLARTRFCARCHRLFDNWPTLDASSTREHDSEPGPEEGWEYAIAVSYTTCELEGSACSGCKLCLFVLQSLKDAGLLDTFRKIEARLNRSQSPAKCSLSVQNWGANPKQLLWLNLPGKECTSCDLGIALSVIFNSTFLLASGEWSAGREEF
jgi:hypothetical protein